MKQLLTILLITVCLNSSAQVKDTAVTDTTKLLSISDISRVAKYLEDKMIAKDYNLVMAALQSILQEAIQRKRKK